MPTLSAAKIPRQRAAQLRDVQLRAVARSAVSYSGGSPLVVDEANGTIDNVAVITEGPAMGHPFVVDALCVQQIADLINAAVDGVAAVDQTGDGMGVRSRWMHPDVEKDPADPDERPILKDDLGSVVGRLCLVRVVDAILPSGKTVKQARGKLIIRDYARKLPAAGGANVRDYLISIASADPAFLGMSASFTSTVEPIFDAAGNPLAMAARPLSVYAVDIVGKPAANPAGLLAAKQVYGPSPPNAGAAAASAGAAAAQQAQPAQQTLNLKFEVVLSQGNRKTLISLSAPDRSAAISQLHSIYLAALMPAERELPMQFDQHHHAAMVSDGHCGPETAMDDASDLYNGLEDKVKADINTKAARLRGMSLRSTSAITDPPAGNAPPTGYHPPEGQPTMTANAEPAGGQGSSSTSAREWTPSKSGTTNSPEVSRPGVATQPGLSARQAAVQLMSGDPDSDRMMVQLEAQRREFVFNLGATMKVRNDVIQDVYARGLNAKEARPIFLAALAADQARAAQNAPNDFAQNATLGVNVSIDNRQQYASGALRQACADAISLRAMISCGKDEEFVQFWAKGSARRAAEPLSPQSVQIKHLNYLEMYRYYLAQLGAREVNHMNRMELYNILGRNALRRKYPQIAQLAESSGDFSGVTLDAINKSMRYYYLDAPRKWPLFCQRGTAPDFKTINRIALSDAASMVNIAEGQEVQYAALTDTNETYVLGEWIGGIKLTKRAIINDDQDAFSAIPRAQANTAARLEEDQVFAVLTINANMVADSNPLFGTAHANHAASATAISTTSLGLGWSAIKKQKGPNGAVLELEPQFLLVPTEIEWIAASYCDQKGDRVFPQQTSSSSVPATASTYNPFAGKLTVIGSTRLSTNSTTRWILAANPNSGQINTLEISFLESQPEPLVRQETEFDTGDVKYAVNHTVAAKALDWRGLYDNAGA